MIWKSLKHSVLCSGLLVLSINEYVPNAAHASWSGLWSRTLLWPDSHMMNSDIKDIQSLLMWVQRLLKCRRSWQCCSWEWFAVSEKHFYVFICWMFHHTNKTAKRCLCAVCCGSGGASESTPGNLVYELKESKTAKIVQSEQNICHWECDVWQKWS